MPRILLFTQLLFVWSALCGQVDIGRRHLVYHDSLMEETAPLAVTYHDTLEADLYMPRFSGKETNVYPCVLFVCGLSKYNYRRGQMYVDWGKLLASRGIVGIVYEVASPAEDFDRLMNFLTARALSLKIDPTKIGLWSCSANSLLAINKVSEYPMIRCQSIYYGLTVTSSSALLAEAKELCDQVGISYYIGSYDSKAPVHIVRAGEDTWALLLHSQSEFIEELTRKNIDVEFINYSAGHHSFDLLDDTQQTKDIIRNTINFFRKNLGID